MPSYAIMDPTDGREPAWRLIGGRAEALPGETVLDQRPPLGSVWDAANGAPRSRTAAERLVLAKAEKRAEVEAAFDAECRRDFPSAFLAAGTMAATPADPRIGALRMRTAKLRDRLAALDAATTEEAVGAISWSATPGLGL